MVTGLFRLDLNQTTSPLLMLDIFWRRPGRSTILSLDSGPGSSMMDLSYRFDLMSTGTRPQIHFFTLHSGCNLNSVLGARSCARRDF